MHNGVRRSTVRDGAGRQRAAGRIPAGVAADLDDTALDDTALDDTAGGVTNR